MKNIIITGITGFVGSNLTNYFAANPNFFIIGFDRKNQSMQFTKAEVIIHLAGKAHDLKNVSNPQDYYDANYELTKRLYNDFLKSDAKKFIFLSSVKASADSVTEILKETHKENPVTHYGKSKLLAEQYIQSAPLPSDKSFYILRPCMIHGPNNKGNLNLLYKMVSKNVPWPLGAFENKRSLCSVENLLFVINELVSRNDIVSGVYNVADDIPLSTNEIVALIAESKGFVAKTLNIPVKFVIWLSKLGDYLNLPINSERIQKLTESYVVSNHKIISSINKQLPVTSEQGLLQTFTSFK